MTPLVIKAAACSNETSAVAATTYKAGRYILLLACEASTEVRDEIAKHAKWEVWDVRDISHKVRGLDEATAVRLVQDHFGPSWRKSFLGKDAATESLLTATEFFAPFLNPKNLFNHSWALAGRTDYLAGLIRFASSVSGEQISILPGRGGIGKSKLLQAFAQEFEKSNPGVKLRFLVEGIPIDFDSLVELARAPLVIVIDDAHRRDDLPQLLAFARRNSMPAPKIILATRPASLERLFSTLTQGGFDGREILKLTELKELGREDVKTIAGQALGDPGSPDIPALVAATFDSPLITLIGGRLIAEKSIDIRLLERHDEFRQAVLSRFQEILIGSVASDKIGAVECQSVLSLISGISPYRLNNSRLQEASAGFIGILPERFIQVLDILEESGVLLRRGYSLRITPDILADHLLHKACATSDGRPTGYADRLFEKFINICPGQVMKNLAELDWRIDKTSSTGSTLLSNIWKALREDFANSANDVRCFILDLLKDTAHLHPAEALELVEFTIRNPIQDMFPAGNDQDTLDYYIHNHARVLDRLPALLRSIGYTLEYLPRCCDLLWELGRDDARQTGPNPEHAIRILEDFAAYDLQKPVRVTKIVVEAIERWLQQKDAHDHQHSPFEILNKVLQKSGHSSFSEGYQFVSRPFLVNPESTREIREKALKLIMNGAVSTVPRIALQAVNSLKIALSNPIPYYDMVIPDEEYEKWEAEQSFVLDLFAGVINKNSNPLVHLRIIDALFWHTRHSKLKPIRQKAQETLNLVPGTFELKLYRLLSNTYDWSLEDETSNDRFKKSTELRLVTAQEFLSRYPNAALGSKHLNDLISEISEALGTYSDPWLFLAAIATSDARYAAGMCNFIVQNPDSMIAPRLGTLLPFVDRADSKQGNEIVAKILESKNVVLQQALAASTDFWYQRWNGKAKGVPEEDLQIIRQLIATNDRTIKQLIISLLPVMWRAGYKEAANLFESFPDPFDYGHLIWACGIFSPFENGIPEEEISIEQLLFLLEKFVEVPSLDDLQLNKFIALAARKAPRETIEMLLRRLKRSDEALSGFDALPPLGLQHKLEGLDAAPDYLDLLRLVRDRMLETNNTLEISTYLPELFDAVSLNFTAPALEILNEWIESGDAEKIEAASRLLKEAPKHFIFEESDFTANLIVKAYKASSDCYDHVTGNLHRYAICGERTGLPGQPFPEDIALRDKSSAIASKYAFGTPVRRFYDRLHQEVESTIKDHLLRDEELIR